MFVLLLYNQNSNYRPGVSKINSRGQTSFLEY